MMTDASVAAAHFATNDFRLGRVISRSGSVLSRYFPTFFIVSLIGHSPVLLIPHGQTGSIEPSEALSLALWAVFGFVLLVVLSSLGDSILLHAAFEDVRRRPVRLADSLNVAVGRLFPLIGLVFLAGILVVMGSILLILPGLFLYTMWFVAAPACVLERRGPCASLRRSRQLTKGYRWKLFGLALLILVGSFGKLLVASAFSALAGPIVGLGGQLVWSGIWAAFSAIVITVSYYDLRVIKEGVDIDQITVVFD